MVEWASDLVAQYGYWAVFVWTFIEGETTLIAAAAAAAAGLLQPWKVIATAALGAWLGHIAFFLLGRWRGMEVIRAFPSLHRHYPKVNTILDRHANWSIFLFQYLYGTRMAAAILFGCSSLTFPRFAALQVLNCLSWAIVVYAAGHALGLAAIALFDRFGLLGLILLTTAGVLLFSWGGGRIQRRLARWWERL